MHISVMPCIVIWEGGILHFTTPKPYEPMHVLCIIRYIVHTNFCSRCYHNIVYLQLFARRSKHVPQKLRKRWDKLNLHYMSEEEDGDEGDVIMVRKLPWRSDSKLLWCMFTLLSFEFVSVLIQSLMTSLRSQMQQLTLRRNLFQPLLQIVKRELILLIPLSYPHPEMLQIGR